MSTFLTQDDLAERFKVDKNTIRQWRYHRKDFPKPVFLGRKVIRFREEDVLRFELFMNQNSEKSDSRKDVWSKEIIPGRVSYHLKRNTPKEKESLLGKKEDPMDEVKENTKKKIEEALNIIQTFKSKK